MVWTSRLPRLNYHTATTPWKRESAVRITAGNDYRLAAFAPYSITRAIWKKSLHLPPSGGFLTLAGQPVAALIPLCILWAGIGGMNKIPVIFPGTVFQLVR